MRQIIFALPLILLPASLPAAEPPSPIIEVHPASPLVDMHFWVRKLASSQEEVPSMPGLAPAVEALHELDSQLGRPSLPLAPAWGAVDLLFFRVLTAAEFSKAAAALPETLTLPLVCAWWVRMRRWDRSGWRSWCTSRFMRSI
ncbi:MAG TPA: hypothetical protein VKM72_19050 [Thermoanaerobaculia bacterium]|nr:hypothetical protein [Thermoanaerobaculia bacterium]